MSLQVVRIKDLIEKPNELPAFNNLLDTTKIYKLVNVIDAVGETIGFPEEIDVVVEVSEIKKWLFIILENKLSIPGITKIEQKNKLLGLVTWNV